MPWGISESAYNVRDLHLNYQYGPFGVPGLGLKRGLIEDLVVAPYATMLAAPINPKAAMNNLRRLEKEGALGAYGYYEAIDYTTERLPQDQSRTLIRAFMAHHQGMSLVALNNVLHDECMEKRFHADPSVQATELLLQERIPVGVPTAHPRAEDVLTGRVMKTAEGLITRVYHNVDTESPRTQLLSNGTYNVMVTVAGGGYSNCGANAVTRWREDVTRDNWGTFIYVRDVRSGAVWSAGYQPIRKQPQSYEVAFAEDKADFRRTDAGIRTHMEVVVSAEVRRQSPKEAWKTLTDMFNGTGRSFVPFHSRLEPIKRRSPETIAVNDVFRYTLNRGTPMYLTVVEWTPRLSFAYEEQFLPMGGKDFDQLLEQDLRDRTEYTLVPHPEGTVVQIRRVERENLTMLQSITGERASHAANMLVFALSGNGFYPDKAFSDGEALEHEDYTVQRDDSLRVPF